MEIKGFAHLLLLLLGIIWAHAKQFGAEVGGSTVLGGSTVFTLHNNCTHTVWPATLSGNTGAAVGGGGFELAPNATVSFLAPAGWSGRLWARTGCVPSGASSLACATGDCSGAASCTLGGAPPVTLAEFTLGGADGEDFYDVSLVDGYNVGIGMAATGERMNYATCGYAGCVRDVNAVCPPELQMSLSGKESASPGAAGAGQQQGEAVAAAAVACRSACAAFGTPEYCCTDAHGGPDSCGPTQYSKLFKAACPAAYSYAYDDPTSTFTCGAGAQYRITFCPAA